MSRFRRTLLTAALLAALGPALAGIAGCDSSTGGHPTTATSDGTGATSTEVSFVSDRTKAYGTLEIPAHRNGQRLAAALLLPGSGPTDRNGNQVGAGDTPGTLQVVATLLARQGIASFRYDKFFTGRTGPGVFAHDSSAITIQDELGQADAAYRFLGQQSAVDPTRLLVIGHSEGGMIALHVATAATTKPVGLALLEPQDMRALDVIEVQVDESINALVAQGRLTVAQARANGAGVAQAIAAFRAGQQPSSAGLAPQVVSVLGPEILQPLHKRYLQSWDAISPVELASGVQRGTRVLVTDGTRDAKVPPRTITGLTQALSSAGTTGPGLVIVQGTDHDMHLANQPDTQAVLAPAVVTAIQQWAQPYALK